MFLYWRKAFYFFISKSYLFSFTNSDSVGCSESEPTFERLNFSSSSLSNRAYSLLPAEYILDSKSSFSLYIISIFSLRLWLDFKRSVTLLIECNRCSFAEFIGSIPAAFRISSNEKGIDFAYSLVSIYLGWDLISGSIADFGSKKNGLPTSSSSSVIILGFLAGGLLYFGLKTWGLPKLVRVGRHFY